MESNHVDNDRREWRFAFDTAETVFPEILWKREGGILTGTPKDPSHPCLSALATKYGDVAEITWIARVNNSAPVSEQEPPMPSSTFDIQAGEKAYRVSWTEYLGRFDGVDGLAALRKRTREARKILRARESSTSSSPNAATIQAGNPDTSTDTILDTSTVPHVDPVRLESIPTVLRSLPNWVLWEFRPPDDGNKWRKVPIDPATGTEASCSDPATWSSYDTALAALSTGKGIGFEFGGSGLVGIDLDECRDPSTGEITPEAQAIVEKLASYTEISPSGKGLHIIVSATKPGLACRKGFLEMYDRARYFTVTGNIYSDHSAVEKHQDELTAIYDQYLRPSTKPKPSVNGKPSGLSEEEILAIAVNAANGEKFSNLWNGDISGYVSQSEADQALANMLAFYCGPDAEAINSMFSASGLYREKWDREDYAERTINKALADTEKFYEPPAESEKGRESAATRMVRLSAEADYFGDPEGVIYSVIPINGHVETWPVRSKAFKRWLASRFVDEFIGTPGAQSLQDAITVIEAKCKVNGRTFVRVAEHQGRIYLDLADEKWRAVEVDSEGWRVVDRPPVHFIRTRSMAALPIPTEGKIDDLRPLINIQAIEKNGKGNIVPETNDPWRLVVAWVLGCLRPNGPYPILALRGEQGSAKTTTARILRSILDPSIVELRSLPKEERDMVISASNSWILGFDNVSVIQAWQSDAMCRIATGAGYGTRGLYTDDEEKLFHGSRPIILNGIGTVIEKHDLLDRAIIITAPSIPESSRRQEKDVLDEFQKLHAGILGGFLSAASAAIKHGSEISTGGLPRMADFAAWIMAAEKGEALPWTGTRFTAAYRNSLASSQEELLSDDPIAVGIRMLLNEGPINDTPSEIYQDIGNHLPEALKFGGTWPKNAQQFGKTLDRLIPALRTVGIHVHRTRANGVRNLVITRDSSHSRPPT